MKILEIDIDKNKKILDFLEWLRTTYSSDEL